MYLPGYSQEQKMCEEKAGRVSKYVFGDCSVIKWYPDGVHLFLFCRNDEHSEKFCELIWILTYYWQKDEIVSEQELNMHLIK